MKIQMITAMVLFIVLGAGGFTGGFLSLEAMQTMVDATEIDSARGYAYFYFFIGAVALALAGLAYRFRDYKY
jgi:hypothetical protein